MAERKFKLDYRGSVLWLIFWVIFFFPIALVLLLTTSTFEISNTVYHLDYEGSRFWLCFWTLVFFPVAFILLFANGLNVRVITRD